MPLPKQYPTYLVLSYGTKGDDYHNWDAKKVNKVVSLAKEMEKLSGEKIRYIDWRNPKDIYIQLETSLVRIGEVDETVHGRIKNIKSLLSKVTELKNKKIKYIDLRWETNYLKLDSSPRSVSSDVEIKNNAAAPAQSKTQKEKSKQKQSKKTVERSPSAQPSQIAAPQAQLEQKTKQALI